MHYPKQERLQIYLAAQPGLLKIEPNPNKQRKYIDFIDFYANLSEQEINKFRTHYLNEEGEIMGLAQILTRRAPGRSSRRPPRRASRRMYFFGNALDKTKIWHSPRTRHHP